jgi:hypothetical protein
LLVQPVRLLPVAPPPPQGITILPLAALSLLRDKDTRAARQGRHPRPAAQGDGHPASRRDTGSLRRDRPAEGGHAAGLRTGRVEAVDPHRAVEEAAVSPQEFFHLLNFSPPVCTGGEINGVYFFLDSSCSRRRSSCSLSSGVNSSPKSSASNTGRISTSASA